MGSKGKSTTFATHTQIPVALVILNDRPPPDASDLQQTIDDAVRAARSRAQHAGESRRGGIFSLRGVMPLLLSVSSDQFWPASKCRPVLSQSAVA